MSRIPHFRRAPAPAEPAPPPDPASGRFACPGCGATLAFTPGEQALTCGFCGAVSQLPDLSDVALREAVREQDYHAALEGRADSAALETTQVGRCESCGAQVEFDPAEHARDCPFCAAPLVEEPLPDRHIRPQALLPFGVERNAAQAAVGRWLSGLWFAPNGLSKYARDKGGLTGVYTPYWTFDARTQTAYSGQRGDTYFVTTRGADGKPRQEARVRWSPRSGRLRRDFDDVLALGATSLPEKHTQALAPWDLRELKPYERGFLAGFRAEAYTVGLRDGFASAKGQMERVIRGDVRAAIGGDQQRIHRIDSRFDAVTFKHILLPVWVGAYRWRGEVYRVVVNGRTGRVRGERPYSVWKIALAVIAALILGAAAMYLAQRGGMI